MSGHQPAAGSASTSRRLQDWLHTQLTGADNIRVSEVDSVEFGHSAEMLTFTVVWRADGTSHRRDAVARLRPPPPGLLEPYDMGRQYQILRALMPTPVRAPRPLWLESTGHILGQAFYVMERLDGTVYERTLPHELTDAPDQVRAMCESLVAQIAAIHSVDLKSTGLDGLSDGRDYLTRQLDHWSGEVERVKRGALPQLERLHHELRRRQPEQHPTVTLVHGDPKPGNFAFVGNRVSAVFDWELADVGDPLADIGWLETNWALATPLARAPGAMSTDELVARWSELTGITPGDRAWYRALQGYKMIVIMLVGSMLFDSGASDDRRLAGMGAFIAPFTQHVLAEIGVDEEIEPGPVEPRPR